MLWLHLVVVEPSHVLLRGTVYIQALVGNTFFVGQVFCAFHRLS